jgi:uncharacterized membrane protein YfcA
MSSFDVLYLAGTIGFFLLVGYGALYLHLWPLCVVTLSVVLLSLTGSIGLLRLVLQGQLLPLNDVLLIAGVTPWLALGALISRRHPPRRAR